MTFNVYLPSAALVAGIAFLAGLLLLFWLPKRPKSVGIGVAVLWALAGLLRYAS